MESPWEDALLERKVESDLKDLRRTLVAFANSVRPSHVALILIGEKDDGRVQGVTNADNIQKTVRAECDKIYPPIVWRSRNYEKDGRPCVRVEIEYSGETPHFGGPAWVRRGSVTVPATEEVFQRLVDFRLSKVRELSLWEGKEITVEGDWEGLEVRQQIHGHPKWKGQRVAKVCSVNPFYVTFESDGGKHSEPLEKVLLSYDHGCNRLKLLVKV